MIPPARITAEDGFGRLPSAMVAFAGDMLEVVLAPEELPYD